VAVTRVVTKSEWIQTLVHPAGEPNFCFVSMYIRVGWYLYSIPQTKTWETHSLCQPATSTYIAEQFLQEAFLFWLSWPFHLTAEVEVRVKLSLLQLSQYRRNGPLERPPLERGLAGRGPLM